MSFFSPVLITILMLLFVTIAIIVILSYYVNYWDYDYYLISFRLKQNQLCLTRFRTPWLILLYDGIHRYTPVYTEPDPFHIMLWYIPPCTQARPVYTFPTSMYQYRLRQLCLPLRGAWALTSPGLPWAGPGDLTTHHATDCTSCLDSDPYATRAAVGHGTQPGSMGRQPAAGATRH
jgi:hypothetical protein